MKDDHAEVTADIKFEHNKMVVTAFTTKNNTAVLNETDFMCFVAMNLLKEIGTRHKTKTFDGALKAVKDLYELTVWI